MINRFIFRLAGIIFILTGGGLLTDLTARHIIGGEMTYVCTDSTATERTYLITMTVYRDCVNDDGSGPQGALFDSDPAGGAGALVGTVTIFQGTTVFGNTIVLNGPQITPIPPDAGNPCLIVPPTVCVQEGIYTFTVTLPVDNFDYTISYSRCCRNNFITNILMPGDVGATYFITLTSEAREMCNSSPVFKNFPPIVLCANEPFELDMAGEDADGDRLVYSFCSPVVGGANVDGAPVDAPNGLAPNPESPPPYDGVSFLAPTYTALQPLGPDAMFTYNDSTGLLSGTPNVIGQFVVGICIDEYRDGVLLSTVKREFQFNITICENTVVADLDETLIDEEGNFVINICGPGDITVVNESTIIQFINDYDWEVYRPNGDTIFQGNRDLTTFIGEVGTYPGTMILNRSSLSNCTDTADFILNIFPAVAADFEFAYDTCIAGPVLFTDLSTTGDPGGITQWDWDFADGGSSSLVNPSHSYQTPGDFGATLLATDGNGCSNAITKNINYFPVPPLILISPSVVAGCVPQDVLFTNLSTPVDETYDIIWDFGDGTGTVNEISPFHTYNEAGIYSVAVDITSPIGCAIDTFFNQLIRVDPAPTAGFSWMPETPTNFRREVDFMDESLEAIAWRYEFSNGFGTLQRNFPYTFRDTGLIDITQYVTHPSGCIDSLTQTIDVEPQITFFMPNAFTPNGDGLNDELIPKAFLFGYQSYAFRIWNRWGAAIFTTEDPNEGWTGRSENNQDAPGGVYLWEAQITGPRGKVTKYRGEAVLLR